MQPLCDVTAPNRFANEIKNKHDYHLTHNYIKAKIWTQNQSGSQKHGP